MKRYLVTLALCSIVVQACFEDEEEKETATMCYVKSGTTVTVNCKHDSLGSCSSDGKSSLGHYDSWDECWDDTSAVLSKYRDTGTLAPGPGSQEAGGGSGGGGGGGGSYNWSFMCSDGVGGTKTLPIPKGSCESQYKAYGKAFGCNDVANFYSTCVSLYTCLGDKQNLAYCATYK